MGACGWPPIGVNGDVAGKARKLLSMGVDCLVVDTAHGHQERMLEALAAVRSVDPEVPVVAGNVVAAEGVRTSSRRARTSSRSASARGRCAPPG